MSRPQQIASRLAVGGMGNQIELTVGTAIAVLTRRQAVAAALELFERADAHPSVSWTVVQDGARLRVGAAS